MGEKMMKGICTCALVATATVCLLATSAQATLIPIGSIDLVFTQDNTTLASASNVPLPDATGMTGGSLQAITWANYTYDSQSGQYVMDPQSIWLINGNPVQIYVQNYQTTTPDFAYVQWYVNAVDQQGDSQPGETLLTEDGLFSVQVNDLQFENTISATASPTWAAGIYMRDVTWWTYAFDGSTVDPNYPEIDQISKDALLSSLYGYGVSALDNNGSFIICGIPEPYVGMPDHNGDLGTGDVCEISWGMAYIIEVPEPASIILFAALGIAIAARRRK